MTAKMPQQHDASHEGRHKAKPAPAPGIKDIECPARRHSQIISSRETKTESTISISTTRRQRQHSHGRPCCTINNILYAVFIALLFLWIILQHLIAQSFRNTTHNSPDSISSWMHNMIIDGDQHHNQQHQQQSMTTWSDQIWRSVSVLLFTSSSQDKSSSSSQRMEDDYSFIFMLLLGINIATLLPSWLKHIGTNIRKKNQSSSVITKEGKQTMRHNQLLQTYLPAYLLATSADWLQGPYKYALYSSYGYTKRDIAQLFVAGYGSGMILGSILGGLADSYGRKKLCLCYCLAYTFSVLMKHCKYFYVLMLGRVGGGIATSLLYSCFESWLIGAHGARGLGRISGLKKEEEERWMAKSLSISMFGSSLVAIGSGILANVVVESSGKMRPLFGAANDRSSALYIGGYISAFDLCLVPLVICATIISCSWEENYGEEVAAISEHKGISSNGSSKGHSTATAVDDEKKRILDDEHELPLMSAGARQRKEGICSALSNGISTVWESPKILICCVVGSVFEGAMYVFIFLWTPTLTSLQEKIDDSDVVKRIFMKAVKDPHIDSDLPFGWIFSTFMVSCMLGTTAFSRVSNAGVSASKCLAGILALAAISCLAMARPLSATDYGLTSSSATTPQYIGMLLYEFCIGFYYPAMGTVKAAIVPEDQRAAIYNVYRLPLNLFMLAYLFGDFSPEASFTANAVFLMMVCILQIRFIWAMTM